MIEFDVRYLQYRTARNILISLIVVFSSFRMCAEIVESEGYGKTKLEAEYDAVFQAVRHVTGMNIADSEFSENTEMQSAVSLGGTVQSRQRFVERLNKKQFIRSKGRVNRWTCNSIDYDEERKQYRARVSVDVAKYSSPDGMPNDQRRIVVLPFETRPGAFKVVTKFYELKDASRKLAEKLNDYITQTRKFAVLDRRYDVDVNKELNRIEGRNASDEDLVQLGNKLATEYMIVGDLRIMDKKNGLDNISESQKDYAMLVLHYRVLLCATTQVKWSDTIEIPASAAVGETEDECVENLLDEGARVLHLAVVENIYPMKLASVLGENSKSLRFILNRGGRGVRLDDTFSLVRLGREILDPDSGEILERQETVIGKIRIVKVGNKTSHAVLVEDSPMPSLKDEDLGHIIVRRIVSTDHAREKNVHAAHPNALDQESSVNRLSDLRRAQYSELEKILYKMRTGNFSGATLSELYRMRKDAPTGEIKGLVEKIVGAGLVSMGDYKNYNRIKKNIEGSRLLESKMRDDCSFCSGSGAGAVTCPDCGGRGKCRNCNGVGSRTYTPRGSFTSIRVACNRCSGENLDNRKASSGQCVRCEGSGKVEGECRKCLGVGKVASVSAAEKLALELIKTALDEFAINRGEKERDYAEDGGKTMNGSLMNNSFNDDSENVPLRGNRRKRHLSHSEDVRSKVGDFGN